MEAPVAEEEMGDAPLLEAPTIEEPMGDAPVGEPPGTEAAMDDAVSERSFSSLFNESSDDDMGEAEAEKGADQKTEEEKDEDAQRFSLYRK